MEEDTSTVEGITVLIQNFANERMWNQHHTPRNICLAMMGEVGELAELFQWKKDEGTLGERLTEKELDKVGQELADVAIYLMRLADVCQVELGCEARKLLIEDDGVEKWVCATKKKTCSGGLYIRIGIVKLLSSCY